MNQRGYTLVELVIVIAVIGIIAAMALPRIGGWQSDQELQVTARELAAEIRHLSMNAVNAGSAQAAYSCNITVTGTNYTVNLYTYNLTTKSVSSVSSRTVAFPQGISCSTSTGIYFSIDGRPCNAAGAALTADKTITLRNATGATTTLSINQNTGRVNIS